MPATASHPRHPRRLGAMDLLEDAAVTVVVVSGAILVALFVALMIML
jgi:hypothetical protein